jgi:hypothetical protein
MGRGPQPSAEGGTGQQRGRAPRQIGEDNLRDVLGEMRVAAHAAERHGIDEADARLHDLRKGTLRLALDIVPKQAVLVVHLLSSRRGG